MKLSELIKTVDKTLPSGLKVTIRTDMPAEDADSIAIESGDNQTKEDKVRSKYELAERYLISWDLTDDDGSPLEINVDNLKKLGLKDMLEILGAVPTDLR
jgi:hypothetical protein